MTTPHALDMAPLAGHVGFLLRLAQQRVFDEFHRGFGPAGLSPARYAVLALLHANPAVPQARLAEALRIKPSNLAVLVAEMAGQGLLERQVDASNRRANQLRLTPAGQALHARLAPEVLAMERQVTQPLNPREHATLVKLLARLNPP